VRSGPGNRNRSGAGVGPGAGGASTIENSGRSALAGSALVPDAGPTIRRSILRARGLIAVAVALALVGGGCGGDDAVDVPGADSATPVVVDSDGAFDDLKAIAYLLQRPDVDVRALTFSGTGIAHCPAAAENASAVLERIGAPDIPVACGRGEPLSGDNAALDAWRTAADTLGGVELPEPRPLADTDAPGLLAETVTGSDDEVVLVALGPLTNVAEALADDPSVAEGIRMVYLMGGAVDAGGNVLYANPDAEFNIWADPEAAAALFAADVPLTLVPLDATNAVPVTPYYYDAVAAHRDDSAVSAFLGDYLEATPLREALYQWDELAAVIATDESVATFEDRTLAVVTEGGTDAGATVEDPAGRPVRVAVAADREAFEARFYQAVLGEPEPDVSAWEPDAAVSSDGAGCTYDGLDPLPPDALLQIRNDGTDVMAVASGTVAEGTTAADVADFDTSGSTGVPLWWRAGATILVPVGARDVWPVAGRPDLTILCQTADGEVTHLAGPFPA